MSQGDDGLRELERQAAVGDEDSAARAARERCRRGQCCAGHADEYYWPAWAVADAGDKLYPARRTRREAIDEATSEERVGWAVLRREGFRAIKVAVYEGWDD